MENMRTKEEILKSIMLSLDKSNIIEDSRWVILVELLLDIREQLTSNTNK